VPNPQVPPLLPTARLRWKARIQSAVGAFDGSGTNPDPSQGLATHAFTNSPAVSSDVAAFASREGCVYVFKTDALVTFHLPFPNLTPPSELAANEASQIQLRGTDEAGQPQPISPLEYTIDIPTQTITFRDMRSFTLDLAQAVPPPAGSGLPPGLYVPI